MPRVLLSVNVVVTESRTLPSAALGKEFFAKCPIKSTRQSAEHSAKSRIPVWLFHGSCKNILTRSIIEVQLTTLDTAKVDVERLR
jgi:hypothetical protein